MTEEKHIQCKACGASGPHKYYVVREMMLGTRQVFNYFECVHCRSLQRVNAIDVGPFYPPQYYSVAPKTPNHLIQTLRQIRDRQIIGRQSLLGYLLAKVWPNPIISRLASLGLRSTSNALEVGCGGGWFLMRLSEWGLKNIVGIDPFASEEIISDKFSVFRKKLAEVEGKFDLIVFNHSLEHIDDPASELRIARSLLTDAGICFVRVPTSSSAAWAEYRENWVQIDAPRHTLVPSREGMKEIARKSGFRILYSYDDSTEAQFIGSELYRRDIPLNESHRHKFSTAELKAFRQKSCKLNTMSRGDQVVYFLSPISGSTS